jgi:hypothetical protein
VGEAKNSANVTIQKYEKRIANLTSGLAVYPEWVQTEIKKQVDPDALTAELSSIKSRFESATEDSEYVQIVKDLLAMNVPVEISTSETGNYLGFLLYDNIDPSYMEEVSLKSYNNSQAVVDAISKWSDGAYDIGIDYKTISVWSESGKEDILAQYKVSIDLKAANEEEAYLLIDIPRNDISFDKGYSERDIGEGAALYIFMTSPGEFGDIEFVTSHVLNVEDLGLYLSPELSKLVIDDKPIEPYEPPKQEVDWLKLGIAIGILLFVVLGVYIILQEWYKRNYEIHLFKNKDELYNLVNFIFNGREHGLKDGEIRSKLKKSGWSGEQITYAVKKLDGKRTGMWEIPIFKSIEKKKVKKEIRKRQATQGDKGNGARFIKPPRF